MNTRFFNYKNKVLYIEKSWTYLQVLFEFFDEASTYGGGPTF
jgi:hypothetical protein